MSSGSHQAHVPDSDPSRMWEAQACALFDVGRYAEALPLLLKALSSRPDDTMLLCRLAYAHGHFDQYAEMQRWAEQAAAANPENEWAHRLRANALSGQKKYKEALAAAQEAARCAPDEPQVYWLLTNLYLARVQIKDARDAAEQMRRLAPQSAEAYSALAAVVLAQAKLQEISKSSLRARQYFCEAEGFAREGLSISPNYPALLNQMAEALRGQGRRAEATPLLHASAQLNPADENTRDLLATNILTEYYLGWVFLVAVTGVLVSCLVFYVFHSIASYLLAIVIGPVFVGKIARPLFRRFGEGWMTRQKRFQTLTEPMQATLRLLASDRRGELISSFATTSTVLSVIMVIGMFAKVIHPPKS